MFNGIILAILVVLFSLLFGSMGMDIMLYTFLFASMFFNIFIVVQLKKIRKELRETQKLNGRSTNKFQKGVIQNEDQD